MEDLPITTPFMLNKRGDLLKCGETHPYIKPSLSMDLSACVESLFYVHTDDLIWFYDNSDQEIKIDIIALCETIHNDAGLLSILPHRSYIEQICAEFSQIETIDTEDSVENAFNKLNNDANNAFCKVRTSNYKYNYGGDNGEIYFRLTNSDEFNWLDVVWNVCVGFKSCLKKVSILKDYQTFGKQFDYISIKGTPVNHLSIDEFLVLR